MSGNRPWQFWIDVGGTFTDALSCDPKGEIKTCKVLSSGVFKGKVVSITDQRTLNIELATKPPPRFFDGYRFSVGSSSTLIKSYVEGRVTLEDGVSLTEGDVFEIHSDETAPVTCIRWLLGKSLGEEIGRIDVRLGTTRGTNALLEREGAKTCFVTTAGFYDLLTIGYQNRPKLFSLDIRKPRPLYDTVVEAKERLSADGEVVTPLDKKDLEKSLTKVLSGDCKSLAVSLLHSHRSGVHEEQVFEIATRLGFEQISLSSRLAALQRIVPRADTTVVDAYLTPVIKEYIAKIRKSIPEAKINLMASSGALITSDKFVGKDSILSGPAGGVVGAARVSKEAGLEKIIGFDMGGTSTDVSRYDGEFERRHEMEFMDPERDAGVRLVSPMLAIETVAAGGGSICWFDGITLRVGPKSAGAEPGPACYGKDGPLTITDLNLYLGRILEEFFPFPLDRNAVERRLNEIKKQLTKQREYSLEELAEGFLSVAVSTMAEPIKKISIAKGYDPREYSLVSFGGAGAQHACRLSDSLAIKKIYQHSYSSILSAYGIGMADIGKFKSCDFTGVYSKALAEKASRRFTEIEKELHAELRSEGVENISEPKRVIDLRYIGQDSVISVPEPRDGNWDSAFKKMHQTLFGFSFDLDVEMRALHSEVSSTTAVSKGSKSHKPTKPEPLSVGKTYFKERWHDTPRYQNLKAGDSVTGPCLVIEPQTSVVIEPGWEGAVTDSGLVLNRAKEESATAIAADCDPINLTLFNNQFMSIAEQMGATLQKTSLSVNIKERLDFSCALFTAGGNLVANAPHIPVHLGAMGQSVKAIIAKFSSMKDGDVFVTNDPYNGGSHLPDVTVIKPFFYDSNILFFTAARAHHAEIGGITPGSMPPFSKNLSEEGVLIRGFRLVSDNQESEKELRTLLDGAPHPSRRTDDNIADINAQIASCTLGSSLLEAMIVQHGQEVVLSYMNHIQNAAKAKMETALSQIDDGLYSFSDEMDDGSKIEVSITIKDNRATVDFTGSGGVCSTNLNANPAIVRSAVLYCFRSLIDEDIPLNDGVLEPVEIIIPKDTILAPPDDSTPLAAVVGGNVETSQRVTDVIFAALGVSAASQGTMNNLLFGRPSSKGKNALGYYETICGGAGAGAEFHGASAVHTNMTNTRITDPEVLEERFPVRLKSFSIRRGSGGEGKTNGGDGVIREIEFLEPLEVSLLTSRRTTSPFGLNGGQPGLSGKNTLIRDGKEKVLKSSDYFVAKPKDLLRIETPGGGGFSRSD